MYVCMLYVQVHIPCCMSVKNIDTDTVTVKLSHNYKLSQNSETYEKYIYFNVSKITHLRGLYSEELSH
jgi:hypothetical protein